MTPTTIDVTVTIAGSLSTIAASVAAIIGYRNKGRIQASQSQLNDIHILVNNRMTEALARINELESRALVVKQAQDIKDAKSDIPPNP